MNEDIQHLQSRIRDLEAKISSDDTPPKNASKKQLDSSVRISEDFTLNNIEIDEISQ